MGMNNRSGLCPKCRSANLKVAHRMHNHSAFNGYHYTRSAYSAIFCFCCGWNYRTKADYVAGLVDMTESDWDKYAKLGLRTDLWL